MSQKNSDEQVQHVDSTDDATHTNTTSNVNVEQHEETPTAPENGTETISQSSPKEDSNSTLTDQESSTPNLAEQYTDLSTEINQSLSGLLEKMNSGNQTLDDIKKDIEEFKKNNLLEVHDVIHHLIQLYDNFVSAESQLDAIDNAFESFKEQIAAIQDIPQSEAVPDPQIAVIKYTLTVVDRWLSEEGSKKLRKSKKLVEELKTLREMLQDSLPPSQEDTETEDGSVVHQEEQEDTLSLLSQANAEMKNELSRFRNNLENVRYDFEEAFARIGDVTLYKTVPDETSDLNFDRGKHMAVDSKRTDDKAQHLQIAESHKAGFYRDEDRDEGEKKTVFFRYEEVTVYRYEEPTDEPTEPDGEPDAENVTADAGGTTEESLTEAGNVSTEEGDETNE